VSHAFHSPLVAPAAEAFDAHLAGEDFGPVGRRVISTVTGEELAPGTDVRALLRRQITDPVLFAQAVERAAKEVDLFIEVGPGRVLSGLAADATNVPAVALDTDDESLTSLLRVVGAAYVAGAPVLHEELFHGRLIRPLEIGAEFSFFASPAEQAPEVRIRGAVRRAGEGSPGAVPQSADQPEGTAEEPSIDLLRRLAAERAELPLEMVREDSRLLDELHLSSVTVMHIIDQATQRLGIPAAQAPMNLATASLRELAEALDAAAGSASSSGDAAAAKALAAGAAPWARPFTVDLDELPLPARTAPEANGRWRVYAAGETPLAESLRQALERGEVGPGVLVCLPGDCAQEHLEQALLGAKEAAAAPQGSRFVLVQHGRGAAGLAKTLRLEAPHLRITIVHAPPVPEAAGWAAAEVAATSDYAEAYYDADGVRRVPTMRVMPFRPAAARHPLDEGDVLLVTGGGKGITAECALAVAADSGAKLAVLGRSDPADDLELAGNLRRMAEAGVTVHYTRADVTDPGQVRRAVGEVRAVLGPVTAVLHGAGRNEPAGLTSLDTAAFRRTFAPKVDGLRNVLAAVEPAELRMLVSFGSIIGRAGLHGEAHYATANEWLADLTREVAERHPQCRSICMEWSVWSEVGMGERLSVVDGLTRRGITPISPEQGVQIMRRLLSDPDVPPVVVISGRTEGIDTVRYDLPALPLLRFVDKPLIRYHGAELVSEVEMSAGTDLYLADHLLDGNLLFPAVFGMEAMAQVASAAIGRDTVPVIEGAEFMRPIIVPPDGSGTIRIAAVVTGDDTVEAAIRSAETGFEVEHFRARLRFTGEGAPDGPPCQVGEGLPPVPLDPAGEMYGDVLFQGRRFQRVRRYHRAAARHVDADVAVLERGDWFAGFLPADLLLGDPGMRDALMHGNQVCVPDATLLPTGIERIHSGGAALAAAGELRYSATERERDGDTYLYDIAVRNASGEVVERWEGLRLRATRKKDGSGPWRAPLLGPYLERTLQDLTGARVAVAVEPRHSDGTEAESERLARAAVAVGRALGHRAELRHRPDGRPEAGGDRMTAVVHGAGLTVGLVAASVVGGAVDRLAERTEEEWSGLLGSHMSLARRAAAEAEERFDTAAARVLAAVGSLRNAGLTPDAPLEPVPAGRGPWTVFHAGGLRIATLVTAVWDVPQPIVLAILTEGRS
jgi:enediyne polyketide synthase